MMRLAGIALVLVAAGAAVLVVTLTGGGAGGSRSYRVELDNAFGLVSGGDVKIAGTRAGKVTGFAIDRHTKRALVDIKLDPGSYRALRTDVFCQSRPQSLIGEYFLDCQPGHARTALRNGATLPVSRTASTIPADLLTDILRLPYRQRLRILLAELGIGLAGRGEDLNAAIRRGSPALRETDRVLAILARENRVLRSLTTNADTVVTALARNRTNIARWVTTVRDTAVNSAARRRALAQTLQRLPGFLEQLRPTLGELSRVAGQQTPTLQDLDASSRGLTRLFDDLTPFTNASRPALRGLGQASATGRQAVSAARPVVAQLRRFAASTPETGRDLSIVLRDLDNPARAVENDPRAAQQRGVRGPTGYTGLEALMQYVFDQSQAINVYDQNTYMLKVTALPGGDCGPYRDAESLKAHPELIAKCAAWYGPNQPGVTAPDLTGAATREHRQGATRSGQLPQPVRAPAGHTVPPALQLPAPGSQGQLLPPLPKPDRLLPPLPKVDRIPPPLPAVDRALLDYLLGP
jgi:virulence factor Mce-like protein